MAIARVLFCGYGSGHMGMLLPVADQLLKQSRADVRFLGLTTAQSQVRQAGYPVMGIADFLLPSDEPALARGRMLARDLGVHPDVGELESAAYLGLSYRDLELSVGVEAAAAQYAAYGRHVFLPIPTMRRVLEELRPDLLVTTNSPRAERAAVLAARQLGVRCICVNALLAVDEVAWLGQPGFADRVCVLNEPVRARLVRAGRPASEVVVTGNPAFDALTSPKSVQAGVSWRQHMLRQAGQPDDTQIVLFAAQPEPRSHPTAPGKEGNPLLPRQVAGALQAWAESDPQRRLAIVRPHPSQTNSEWAHWPQRQLAAGPLPLASVLHAVDAVVTLTSTVGVEASVAGKPVIQVLGSIFDHALPLADMGMAVRCERPVELATIIDRVVLPFGQRPTRGHSPERLGDASIRVCQQITELLK